MFHVHKPPKLWKLLLIVNFLFSFLVPFIQYCVFDVGFYTVSCLLV
uniref:Uncharacterized protein n=1 Tax=Arundo donax TaxID=35708 RepID=A0A0A9BS58_ARUDO